MSHQARHVSLIPLLWAQCWLHLFVWMGWSTNGSLWYSHTLTDKVKPNPEHRRLGTCSTIKYSSILKWKKKPTIVGSLETHTRLSLSVTLIVVLGCLDSTGMSTGWDDTLTFYFLIFFLFLMFLFLSCLISFVPLITWRVPSSRVLSFMWSIC